MNPAEENVVNPPNQVAAVNGAQEKQRNPLQNYNVEDPIAYFREEEKRYHRAFNWARYVLLDFYLCNFKVGDPNVLLVPAFPSTPLPSGVAVLYRHSTLDTDLRDFVNTISDINWSRFNDFIKRRIWIFLPLDSSVGWRVHEWFLESMSTLTAIFARAGCDVLINIAAIDKLKTLDTSGVVEFMRETFNFHTFDHCVDSRFGNLISCSCYECLASQLKMTRKRIEKAVYVKIGYYLNKS